MGMRKRTGKGGPKKTKSPKTLQNKSNQVEWNNNVQDQPEFTLCSLKVTAPNSSITKLRSNALRSTFGNLRTYRKGVVCNCGKIICKAGQSKCFTCVIDLRTVLEYPHVSLKVVRIPLTNISTNTDNNSTTCKAVERKQRSIPFKKKKQLILKHSSNIVDNKKRRKSTLKRQSSNLKQPKSNLRRKSISLKRKNSPYQTVQSASKITFLRSNISKKQSPQQTNNVKKRSKISHLRSKNNVEVRKKNLTRGKKKVQRLRSIKCSTFVCSICKKTFKQNIEKLIHEFWHNNKEPKIILDRNEVNKFFENYINPDIYYNSNVTDELPCSSELNTSIPNGNVQMSPVMPVKYNESSVSKVPNEVTSCASVESKFSESDNSIDRVHIDLPGNKDRDLKSTDLILCSDEGSEPAVTAKHSPAISSEMSKNKIEPNPKLTNEKADSIDRESNSALYSGNNMIHVSGAPNVSTNIAGQIERLSETKSNGTNIPSVGDMQDQSFVEDNCKTSGKSLNGGVEQHQSLDIKERTEAITSGKLSSPRKVKKLVKSDLETVDSTTDVANVSDISSSSDTKETVNVCKSREVADTSFMQENDCGKLLLVDSVESRLESNKNNITDLNKDENFLKQSTLGSEEQIKGGTLVTPSLENLREIPVQPDKGEVNATTGNVGHNIDFENSGDKVLLKELEVGKPNEKSSSIPTADQPDLTKLSCEVVPQGGLGSKTENTSQVPSEQEIVIINSLDNISTKETGKSYGACYPTCKKDETERCLPDSSSGKFQHFNVGMKLDCSEVSLQREENKISDKISKVGNSIHVNLIEPNEELKCSTAHRKSSTSEITSSNIPHSALHGVEVRVSKDSVSVLSDTSDTSNKKSNDKTVVNCDVNTLNQESEHNKTVCENSSVNNSENCSNEKKLRYSDNLNANVQPSISPDSSLDAGLKNDSANSIRSADSNTEATPGLSVLTCSIVPEKSGKSEVPVVNAVTVAE